MLLRKRDARHPREAQFGKVKRKPAPPAADIEHAVAGFDEELRGEMAFLGELRIIERLVIRLNVKPPKAAWFHRSRKHSVCRLSDSRPPLDFVKTHAQ